jgi:hypothetical protein
MMGRIGFILLFISCFSAKGQQVYEVQNGIIRFHSDAPQELIRASSTQLQGAIDVKKKTFAFRIGISSFLGFNSPLQREHFNENYMETEVFPEATYLGKIIEDIDLTKDGEYVVRAKGKLKIHGVEQERIIRSTIISKNGKLSIQSGFVVFLADHNIKIPRVVYNKLSPEINVSVNAALVQRN